MDSTNPDRPVFNARFIHTPCGQLVPPLSQLPYEYKLGSEEQRLQATAGMRGQAEMDHREECPKDSDPKFADFILVMLMQNGEPGNVAAAEAEQAKATKEWANY